MRQTRKKVLDKLQRQQIKTLNTLFALRSKEFHFKRIRKYNDLYKSLSSEIVNILHSENIQEAFKDIKKQYNTLLKKEKLEHELYSQWRLDTANFINNKFEEPNKISDEDAINLCQEFYRNFIITNKKLAAKLPKQPNVKIICLEQKINTKPYNVITSQPHQGYMSICTKFHSEIGDNNPSKYHLSLHPDECISSAISNIMNIKVNAFGGILSTKIIDHCYLNIRSYLTDQLVLKNNKEKIFWNWFLRSLDVIAIFYVKKDNTCYVIKKPDELKFDIKKNEIFFRCGKDEFYYKNKIKLPVWLYKADVEDLKVDDYFLLQNADAKASFIEKFGIDRLAKLGTIIDSYENYPDNESWIKSEYKIIDMHTILPPKQIQKEDAYGYITTHYAKPYTYAPFLYMKNQTTGVYHLEGLHPSCKTLYDALRMRYNMLNIQDYEIKDIK